MGEFATCPNCNQPINLEIDIYKDRDGSIYCNKCDNKIIWEN